MLAKEILLINQGGLHARPATFFVQLCNTFKSSIKVALGDKQANAKSIISVMALGAGKGKTIILSIEGDDEELALEKISEYFMSLHE